MRNYFSDREGYAIDLQKKKWQVRKNVITRKVRFFSLLAQLANSLKPYLTHLYQRGYPDGPRIQLSGRHFFRRQRQNKHTNWDHGDLRHCVASNTRKFTPMLWEPYYFSIETTEGTLAVYKLINFCIEFGYFIVILNLFVRSLLIQLKWHNYSAKTKYHHVQLQRILW